MSFLFSKDMGNRGNSVDNRAASDLPVYNVKSFGATGKKDDNAQKAIQKAIDACAATNGGLVYFPPGDYPSGKICLRRNVRLHLEAGSRLYALKEEVKIGDESELKNALIFGEHLENVTIEGCGTLDGQAEYVWRLDDFEDDFIRPNKELMLSLGKPVLRSFPKDMYGRKKLILLLNCKNVRISGISLVNSPSWTLNLYGCERTVIDSVYIYSSLKEGVWADGIDADGCKDLRIANCTVETGDDALAFYSMNWFGPALPCENITVTNCRLTSASSAIKFCDGNMNCIRNVTIDNCVVVGANRGIAFMNFDGGYVSDVVLSNLVVDCTRHDWFWWGDGDPIHFNIKRRSEIHKSVKPGTDAPAGIIRRVHIKNVIARGKGSSICNGHPDSWLEDVTIENLKLYISSDPKAPYEKAVHCLQFQWAKNLKLKDVEVFWCEPESSTWESALFLKNIKDLVLESFKGRQAKLGFEAPAVRLEQVEGAVIRGCVAPEGTTTFLQISGDKTKDILLIGNDFHHAKAPYKLEENVEKDSVREAFNVCGIAGQ